MEVKLEKRYPLDVSPAQAWAVLRDVPTTAGCMPGASITEQVDATHYKGAVKVKVGPASAAFAGDIEVLALDEAAMRLQLLGKGADRAGSSASMNLTATVLPGETPDTAVLLGDAAVIVNGKFAQFGGRLMVQVSDMLLAQFVDHFRAVAATVPMDAGAPAAAATTSSASAASPASPEAIASPATSAGQATTDAMPVATPSRPQQINGLAIAWMLAKNWFAGLFGRRA